MLCMIPDCFLELKKKTENTKNILKSYKGHYYGDGEN